MKLQLSMERATQGEIETKSKVLLFFGEGEDVATWTHVNINKVHEQAGTEVDFIRAAVHHHQQLHLHHHHQPRSISSKTS